MFDTIEIRTYIPVWAVKRMHAVLKLMQKYPDEDACYEFFFKKRWPSGFICPKCGEARYVNLKSRKRMECTTCKTQTSLTAGTIMHGTKLPLRYWLLALAWVASGEYCTARKLAQTLQLHYRSALLLLNKIRSAMSTKNAPDSLAFWQKGNERDHQLLNLAKQTLKRKAVDFIRRHYRRVTDRNLDAYFHEFWFRNNHAHHRGNMLSTLIHASSATIWFRMNTYAPFY